MLPSVTAAFPLISASARAAFPLALPLYGGIAIASGVLFGPNGMSTADACRALRLSFPLSLGLTLAWLVALLPVARALLAVPETYWLRSLPIHRGWHVAIHASLLLLAEFPWLLLWARGEGFASGLTMATLAAAAHALLASRPRRPLPLLTLAVILLLLAAPLPILVPPLIAPLVLPLLSPLPLATIPLALLPVALLLLGIATLSTWARAPESARGAARRSRLPLAGPATIALAVCHAAALWRLRAARLARALLLTALGAGIAHLVIRNNLLPPDRAALVSLATAGAALVLALAGIAADCVRQEASAAWLLDATGTPPAARVLATALAPSAIGLVLGLAHVACLHAFAAAQATTAAAPIAPSATAAITANLALHGLWGANLGSALALAARWSQSARDRAGRYLAAVFVLFAAAVIGPLGGDTWFLAVATAAVVAATAAACDPRWFRAHHPVE